MNPTVKSILWMAAASVVLYIGAVMHYDRKTEELEQELAELNKRGVQLAKDVELIRARVEVAQAESVAGAGFESSHVESMAKLEEHRTRAAELVAKWQEVDADRAAAVKEVREKASDLPPRSLTLADGTQLEEFVVRSVPDEKTISAEHASGLVKIPAEKLPGELKEWLGLAWLPEPPQVLTLDRDGNMELKPGVRPVPESGEDGEKGDDGDDIDVAGMDTSSVAAVSKALAVVEAQLVKTQKDFDNQRVLIRKYGIFKPDVKTSTGKTYGTLKKEANIRLAKLAQRLQKLRAERNNLQHRMKSF